MASQPKRVRSKRVTLSHTKRRKGEWHKANPRITIGDQYQRWDKFKNENFFQSNEEVARTLLDCWYSKSSQQPSDVQELHSMHMEVEVAPQPFSTPAGAGPSQYGLPDISVSDVSSEHHDRGKSSDTDLSTLSGVDYIDRSHHAPDQDKSLVDRYLTKAADAPVESFISISFTDDTIRDDPRDPSYSPAQSEDESDLDMDFDMSLCLPESQQLSNLPNINDVMDNESDSSDDEDTDEELTDIETTEDPVAEKKSLCFQSCLEELAKTRIPTVCQRKGCQKSVQLKWKYVGSASQMIWTCSNGHKIHSWNSQPCERKVFLGNFLLSSAVLTSGNNFTKIVMMANFLNLGMISYSTHMKFQRLFAAPVIGEYYENMMAETFEKFKDKEIVIAGDGRNDSPGHSAMYCTYTFMEYDTKDILASVIIDKRMTDLKSTAMEKEGLLRALNLLQSNGLNVVEICTDAHPQISAMMKQRYPDIIHSYDTWHGAKNFGKKLSSVAAESRNKDIRPWIQDIINHFWYCSRKAEGDEMAFISRWRGILHHVTNSHEWVFGDGSGPAQCEHADLDQDNEDKWIEPGSHAHESLAKVVLDTRFLHTLKYFVNFRHTGELENFHELLLMYASKRFAYSFPMYKARNQLAVIDYMKHKDREQASDKNGEKIFARKYSKRNNNWSAVPVKTPKDYNYMPDLLHKVLLALRNHRGPLPTKFQLEEDDPRRIRKTIAAVSPIPTKELVLKKKSRFTDN